jgi:hypothetical protein
MGAFVVRCLDQSVTQLGMPAAQDIDAAWVAVPSLAGGRWAGPPRITRTSQVGERFRTTLVGVYVLPPWAGTTDAPVSISPPAASVRNAFARQLLSALRSSQTVPGWQHAVTVPYLPAINGDLAWWASGQAAVTQTREASDVPTFLARVDTPENPVGPTTAATHTASVPQQARAVQHAAAAAGAAAGAAVSSALPLAAIAAGGLVLYLAARKR